MMNTLLSKLIKPTLAALELLEHEYGVLGAWIQEMRGDVMDLQEWRPELAQNLDSLQMSLDSSEQESTSLEQKSGKDYRPLVRVDVTTSFIMQTATSKRSY